MSIYGRIFWRYLKMIVTVYPKQWLYFNVWFEFLVALLFLFLLIWGWYKKNEYGLRASWLTFATAAYLLPTFTGTFSSLPRYVLVCFPCFLVLARIITDWKRWRGLARIGFLRIRMVPAEWIFLGVSLVLLVITSMFFFRGYWVA